MRFTTAEKLQCVQREAKRRRERYPSAIARGQMTDASAWRELDLMQAIIEDYAEKAERERLLLFAPRAAE